MDDEPSSARDARGAAGFGMTHGSHSHGTPGHEHSVLESMKKHLLGKGMDDEPSAARDSRGAVGFGMTHGGSDSGSK